MFYKTYFKQTFMYHLFSGEYAFTAADEASDKEKRKIFHQFLANRKADLNVWTRTYRYAEYTTQCRIKFLLNKSSVFHSELL